MKKKVYEKPTMTVVEFQHTTKLLTGSEVRSRGASLSVEYEEEDI